MKFRKVFTQIVFVLLLTLLLLVVPRLAATVADQFDFSTIDPDGAFAWFVVRHIVQALIILIFMVIISKVSDIRFGFVRGDSKVGWFYVRVTALVFLGYAVISMILMLITRTYPAFPYPLNTRNIIGWLGFQVLFPGPSEELIFRAFAMTLLSLMFTGVVASGKTGFGRATIKIFGGEITIVNLIAAVIFGLAHIRFTLFPFSATYVLGQVIFSTFIGLFYGICYERSGSVFYPMIMHNIVNTAVVSVSIIGSLLSG